MHRILPYLAIIALAITSLACGVQIHLPVTNVTTGELVTEDISINKPDTTAEVTDLTINFGLGTLHLSPGADTTLVDGTAVYNIADLKPEIRSEDNQVVLETGDLEINGIPRIDDKEKNEWDLQLGDMPIALKIYSGAYKGDYEMGGLSIESLTIMDGASDVKLAFSEPNMVAMDKFIYQTGASSVKLYGLANANFSEMDFKSGAGEYILEFSGELLQDADVTINSGMSSVTIVVPDGTSTRIFFDAGLANVDIHGTWENTGNLYTIDGDGPMLTINVNMAAGNLTLRN